MTSNPSTSAEMDPSPPHPGPSQTSSPKTVSNTTSPNPNPIPNPSSSSSRQPCAKCGQSMTGQFVRALGTVYHLDCFRCQDCGKVVASKFFPVDGGPDNKSQYPLCETDYFRRLGLICAQCGGALRGSYITALDMKFHVEHFTCSVCPTVFGPQDSYYEHSGRVYCHFHYSTRFAVKCTGCRTAILKQFVEINRNNTDEHWHPECYMINKFWNIKLAVSTTSRKAILPRESAPSPNPESNSETTSSEPNLANTGAATQNQLVVKSSSSNLAASDPSTEWQLQESTETAQTLREKQKLMEEQVYRIWTVLSTFEESSAACISEMLRHVSGGHYLEGVRMAGKFILHVETLFAAIDDLDSLFRAKSNKEISHVREARMLCKKIVNFFSLLSHTHETGARKMSITQELLSLVTGLAHYLKILIRIALTSALKLERDYFDRTGVLQFLNRLDRLARDPESSKATAPIQSQPQPQGPSASPNQSLINGSQSSTHAATNNRSRTYGYKSLTKAVGPLTGQGGEATTDLCESCKLTIEEECVRFGTSLRWHTSCLKCSACHRSPSKVEKSFNQLVSNDTPNCNQPAQLLTKRFRMDFSSTREGGRQKALVALCEDCANLPNTTSTNDFQGQSHLKEGFESVTRLEQYAFLLCVALNKLYGLLKQRGVLPVESQDQRNVIVNGTERSLYDAYRNSTDIKRMKSVDLDRKLSTTARLPQRSTIVESPSGRVAQAAIDPQNSQTSLRPQDLPSSRNNNSRSPITSSRQLHERTRPTNPLSGAARERDYSNLPRSDPPPRPPPTHLNMIPQNSNQIMPSASGNLNSPTSLTDPNSINHLDQRPSLSRNLTAVKIVVEDHPGLGEAIDRDEPRLGSSSSPVGTDTAGITLADLPRAMEAEQFREQRKPLPTQVSTLSELSALESVIVKHVAALTLASESSSIKDETSLDELLEIIEARKGNFWGKLFKGGNDKAKVKKKGVFGIPLDVLVERHGVDSLLGAGAGQLRVPSFVDECISAMKQMDMSVEGVFRKNGNIRRLKELADAIDRDDGTVNFSDDNAVQLAALLKKFLRDLPDPLLTFKLYHLFIASQRVDNDLARRKALHLICCLLPKAHRDTMEVLFVFLKWVASFSHVDEETGSKMDLQNLATVITPNILYARSKDPTRDESFLAIRAVHELLEFQDELFQVPAEVQMVMQDQELLNSNMNEITSKDIIKRVEALLKSNNGRSKSAGKAAGNVEHYRGKGEVHPHLPDLHASSFNQDGGRSVPTENNHLQFIAKPPVRPYYESNSSPSIPTQSNGFHQSHHPSHSIGYPTVPLASSQLPHTLMQQQESPYLPPNPHHHRESPYGSPSHRQNYLPEVSRKSSHPSNQPYASPNNQFRTPPIPTYRTDNNNSGTGRISVDQRSGA